MSPTSDQQLLQALCQGANDGLREIYRRHTPEVRRWVLQNNGSEADAQDLFQDALMAIYDRYCGTGFQLTGSFGGLLMTICRRKWFDRLKEKTKEISVRNTEALRYEEESENADLLVQAEEALAHQRQQDGLARAFEQLSDQCRRLLTLLSQNLSVEAVGEQLGLAANAVYQSKHRCMARWRQVFLEGFGIGD